MLLPITKKSVLKILNESPRSFNELVVVFRRTDSRHKSRLNKILSNLLKAKLIIKNDDQYSVGEKSMASQDDSPSL